MSEVEELEYPLCVGKQISLTVTNHAGHNFKSKGRSVLDGLTTLAQQLGYKNNADAGFTVLEINGVSLSDHRRYMELGIALWEYKGHENEDFWIWNYNRIEKLLGG